MFPTHNEKRGLACLNGFAVTLCSHGLNPEASLELAPFPQMAASFFMLPLSSL